MLSSSPQFNTALSKLPAPITDNADPLLKYLNEQYVLFALIGLALKSSWERLNSQEATNDVARILERSILLGECG